MARVKITLRLRPELAAALRERAAREMRSMSEMLRVALEDAIVKDEGGPDGLAGDALQVLPGAPLAEAAQKKPRPKGRGVTVTVFLDESVANGLKMAAGAFSGSGGVSLNGYVNAALGADLGA